MLIRQQMMHSVSSHLVYLMMDGWLSLLYHVSIFELNYLEERSCFGWF